MYHQCKNRYTDNLSHVNIKASNKTIKEKKKKKKKTGTDHNSQPLNI